LSRRRATEQVLEQRKNERRGNLRELEKKKSRVWGRGKLRETKREGERPRDRGGEKQRGRTERGPESSVRTGDRETQETRDP
jgi:hypothetical protein